MVIPNFEALTKPMLNYASDRREHSFRDTIEFLANKYNLTEDERTEYLPSRVMRIFDNRVGWTLFYLKKAGLLEGTKRGFYKITQEGLEVIAQNPVEIDTKYLERFPKFQEFMQSKNKEEEEIGSSSESPDKNGPKLWVVRAGKKGERERNALEQNEITIGWSKFADFSNFKDIKELKQYYLTVFPFASKGQIAANVVQIWKFIHQIKNGDLVILPLKSRSTIVVGEVIGDYEYRKNNHEKLRHIREVEWMGTISRTDLDRNILNSINVPMTVFQIKRDKIKSQLMNIIEKNIKQRPANFDNFLTTEDEEDDDDASYKADERTRITEVDYSSFLKDINLDNISKFEPHSLRNPERVKVNQIIQNCSKGIWVLPNFQRYYSWRKNHVKEFLESIFNDYYVGSLLFWDAAKELQLDTMPIKGSEVKKDELDPSLIILDGQQRITSLYYAIKAPNFQLEGTRSPVYFYINFHSFFNPETKGEIVEILNRKLTNEESFRRMVFPFYQLDEFNKWTYDFEDFMLKTSPENYDKIRKIRSLIERKLWHIREGFEIPYISLPESMDIGQITDIFERTNTMGIKLNAFDLLIARLSKHDIELRKIWEEVIKLYPKFENYQKFNEKMPSYILQAIALFYDKTSACKRDDILNIYPRIFEFSNMDFEETWYDMSDYMNKAINRLENLRDGFGVKDEYQLPFSPTLPILAALIKELDTRSNKISCNTKINIWYWSSVFSNAYSGAVDSQLTSDFREVRTWFSDDSKIPRTVERARRELISLNFRRDVRSKGSALFKGVLSILALEGAKDFDTKQVLENAVYNDRDHIFPIAEFVSERDLNSVLNMTWMSGETNRHIKGYKKPSIYIKKFIDDKYGGNESEFLEMLKTHMINSTAYNFMKKDDFEGFIEERQKLIIAKIYNLLGVENLDHGTEIGNAALISPDTPFSNKMIIWDTIKSCQDYIYWIDKYFSAEGLQLLIGSVDEKKIQAIKILTSLTRIDYRFRRLFQDFKIEILKKKSINCELRIMNNKLGSSIHDRWIISKDSSFNIPSPDVIARGQFSEVKSTSNRPPFEKWWDESLDIITRWNEIEMLRNKI